MSLNTRVVSRLRRTVVPGERIGYAELDCAKFAVWKFLPAHVSHPDALALGRSPRLGYCPRGRWLDLIGSDPVVLWARGKDYEPRIGADHREGRTRQRHHELYRDLPLPAPVSHA